ncbi:uncharacterized protein LOC144444275 [Glandiceps talaboti]
MSKAKQKDITILQKPVILAKNGIQQIFDCFRYGTTDLKMLLQHEIDIIYECRVCRNLFRGLPNFIDHKKSYCTTRVSVAEDLASQNPNKDVQNIFRRASEEMPQLELEVSSGKASKANTEDEESEGEDPEQEATRNESILMIKPIDSTSKAVYQQLLKPVKSDLRDRILTAKQKTTISSNTTSPKKTSTYTSRQQLDTTSLVDEISARRAAQAGITVVQPECPDKKYDTRSVNRNEVKTIKPIYKQKEVVKRKPEVKKKVLTNKSSTSKAKNFAATRLQNLKPFTGPNPNYPMCVLCKKVCKNRTSLAWHMRVHSKHLYKCPMCPYFNYSTDYLRQHLQHRHDASEGEIQRVLSNRITTNKEMDIKGEKEVQALTVLVKECHKLPQNSTQASTKEEKNSAEETLADVKVKEEPKEEKNGGASEQTTGKVKVSPTLQLHKCSVCDKTFASRRNLARHEKQHSEQNEDQGDELKPRKSGSDTTNKSALAKAQAAVDALIDEKSLTCQRCHKKLFTIHSLRHHVRSHFGYNSYKCRYCAFRTTDYSNLKRHLARKHSHKFKNPDQIKAAIRSMRSGIWLSRTICPKSPTKANGVDTPTSSVDVKKEALPQQQSQTTTSPASASASGSAKTSPSGSSPRTQIRLERIPLHVKTEKESGVKTGSGYVNPVKMAAIARIINEKHLRCLRCKKQFEGMQLLKKHAARHLGYNTFKCKFCEFISHSYSWFKRHLMQSHSRKIRNTEQLSKLMSEMRAVQN